MLKLPNGKYMPVEADHIGYLPDETAEDYAFSLQGVRIQCRILDYPTKANPVGYLSHFSTCTASRHAARLQTAKSPKPGKSAFTKPPKPSQSVSGRDAQPGEQMRMFELPSQSAFG